MRIIFADFADFADNRNISRFGLSPILGLFVDDRALFSDSVELISPALTLIGEFSDVSGLESTKTSLLLSPPLTLSFGPQSKVTSPLVLGRASPSKNQVLT